MLAAPTTGPARIVVFILVTVLSDVGGYAVGVLLGRHPMAPSVSPKKSWEGFAGSVVACVVGGAVAVLLAARRALVGRCASSALAAAVAATVGDLTESTHQARPRHQGHGQRCCPATAASWTGSTRCVARRPGRLGAADLFVPAGLSHALRRAGVVSAHLRHWDSR